jgi:hypothetical protein
MEKYILIYYWKLRAEKMRLPLIIKECTNEYGKEETLKTLLHVLPRRMIN